MFKIRARRDNEPRRQDTKATSREARSSESKPQLLDAASLKHVTGGAQTQLPRTGGW
jgi:hypothetical protein